jgi:hypothetical protein
LLPGVQFRARLLDFVLSLNERHRHSLAGSMRGVYFSCGLVLAMDQGQNSPGAVQKVVDMLNDIKKETEAEAQNDKELHDKMVCWCTTNRADKTESISSGKQSVSSLTARIEEDKATIGKLETQLEELEKERSNNKNSLDQATEMRAKQNDEYDAAHADAVKAIGQLGEAVKTLESNFGADGSTLLQVAAVVKHTAHQFQSVLEKDYASMIDSLRLDDDEAAVQSESSMFGAMFGGEKPKFMPATALAQQQGPGYQSYNAKSGKILGLLKQMKEGMEHDDEDATATEKAQAEAFAELKTTLENEIAAQTNKINDKTTALADTKVDLENSSTDLEQTEATLEADEAFLADLEESCTKADTEYDSRAKERNEELQAVSETIGILTSDEAREMMSGAGQFVQVRESTTMSRALRSRISSMLGTAARKSGSRMLLSLSLSVQIHGLGKVKEAMTKMIANLKEEQTMDDEKKDHCSVNLRKTSSDLLDAKIAKENTDIKVQDLEVQIADLNDKIAAMEKDIAETQVAVKRAGEDRGMENREYQKNVADQRAAQKILAFALKRLESFYNKKSLLSVSVHRSKAPGEAPAPPPEQATYESNGSAGGVMEMIRMIIADSKRDEQASIADETDAQQEYEKLLTDSFDAIEHNRRSVTDKKAIRAEAENDLVTEHANQKDTDNELEDISATSMQLHAECDFLVKNFVARRDARTGEIESIEQAIVTLEAAEAADATR